jgi:hypothetical protein
MAEEPGLAVRLLPKRGELPIAEASIHGDHRVLEVQVPSFNPQSELALE